jgi:hypothetical protein
MIYKILRAVLIEILVFRDVTLLSSVKSVHV